MKTQQKHWAIFTAFTLGLTGLTSAANHGSEKYTYDASGNIVEKSINAQVTKLSYDAANKVIAINSASKGSERISYDGSDRPISYTNSSGQTTRQLTYGYADKVMQAGISSGKAGFFYNAEGQLVGKSVEGKLRTYTWDGNAMAAEDAEIFINEDHITGGIPVLSRGSEVVVSDFLGNTFTIGEKRVLVSCAYGEGLEDVRFTGKPFIKELASFVFPHRLYSPEMGQWNTTDPSGYPDGINNRKYVSGDPVWAVDPTGLAQSSVSCEVLPLGAGTVVGTIEVFYTYDKDNVPKYKKAGRSSPALYGASMSSPTGKVTATGTETPTGDLDNRWFYYKDVKATGQVSYRFSYNASPVSAFNRLDNQGKMIDAKSDSGTYEK